MTGALSTRGVAPHAVGGTGTDAQPPLDPGHQHDRGHGIEGGYCGMASVEAWTADGD